MYHPETGKTIIVPYLAYLLCFFDMKLFLPSFTMIAMFSMEPMLERENQVYTYITLTIMFYILSKTLIEVTKVSTAVAKKEKEVNSTNCKNWFKKLAHICYKADYVFFGCFAAICGYFGGKALAKAFTPDPDEDREVTNKKEVE